MIHRTRPDDEMAADKPINPLDYGTSTPPVYRSRRRWKLVMRFGGAAVLFLIAVVLTGLWEIRDNIYFPWNPALKTLEDNGVACSDDPDNVRVFVPETGGGEKQFGDRQLLAIIQALSHIDHFNSLNLHGSSVTDASVGQLKTVTALEELDVSDTPVTVNGLLLLRGLPRLHRITFTRDSSGDRDATAQCRFSQGDQVVPFKRLSPRADHRSVLRSALTPAGLRG